MDLETVIQSEISQEEKKKYINTHMWNLKKKNGKDYLIYKAEIVTQM